MAKHRQTRGKKILSSSLAIFALLIVLGLISWAVFNSLSQQKSVDFQAQKLEQEIQELEQQNVELASLIDYFASNEYIEKEAREKLNLAQPGEKVIIIQPSDETNETSNNSASKLKTSSSPAYWWNYFFAN